MNVIGDPLWEAALITNVAATVYTSTGCRTRVDALPVSNPNAIAYTVTLHVIASGGAASATNTMIFQRTILPGQTQDLCQILGSIWLGIGGFIQMLASTTNVLSSRGSGIKTT